MSYDVQGSGDRIMAVLGCFTVVAVVLVFTFVMFAGMYVMAVL